MSSLTSWISLVGTIALYYIARKIWRTHKRIWLSPILTVSTVLIIILLVFNIPYTAYAEKGHWLTWFMGPSVVAFAIPIYEYRKVIAKHWLPLVVGVAVGMSVAVVTSVMLSRLLHLPEIIERSLAVRSISTPFAMITAPKVGGSADLAVLFVVMTGIFGMVAGQILLNWLPVRSALARGALFGAGAHAIGTSTAHTRNVEEGVISSLTMIIAGVLLVLLAPLLNALL